MFKFADFGLDVDLLLLVSLVLIIVLFVMMIVLFVKNSILKRRYETFMDGQDGKTLEKSFEKKFQNMDYINDKIDDIEKHLDNLDVNMLKTYQKVGIVKYDAFKEIGGTLSFVLTLLTKDNDGFILNSMQQ